MGTVLLWQLLAPIAVGGLTGACVAAASGLVEGQLLNRLALLPGLVPAVFSPLALIATWLVGRFVTRTFTPATSELYILTYLTPGRACRCASCRGASWRRRPRSAWAARRGSSRRRR
ncbi:MAG: hypothetical protein U0802_10865 [Candidatus Binatia bacterium]